MEEGQTRVAIATMARARNVHPWQVILEATDYAHELMTECAEPVNEVRDRGESAAATLDADTLDRHITSFRLAHKLGGSAITTRAAELRAQHGTIEAKHIAAVIESSLAGVWAWLTSCGLSDADLTRVKRSVGVGLKSSLDAVPDAPRDRDGKPQLPSAQPPTDVDHLVILPRSEVESMRNTIMRLRPSLDSKPANIAPPDDYAPSTPPTPPRDPTGSTSDHRPPDRDIGLLGLTATTHLTGTQGR